MADRAAWSEAEEMLVYRAGQKVELKHRPGAVDTIIGYDPYMVPPVMLANDPQPRYPEELTVVGTFDWFAPLAKFKSTSKNGTKTESIGAHRRRS